MFDETEKQVVCIHPIVKRWKCIKSSTKIAELKRKHLVKFTFLGATKLVVKVSPHNNYKEV